MWCFLNMFCHKRNPIFYASRFRCLPSTCCFFVHRLGSGFSIFFFILFFAQFQWYPWCRFVLFSPSSVRDQLAFGYSSIWLCRHVTSIVRISSISYFTCDWTLSNNMSEAICCRTTGDVRWPAVLFEVHCYQLFFFSWWWWMRDIIRIPVYLG